MVFSRQSIVDYYSNERILEQLVKNAKSREVAGALFSGAYEKRPNMIQFPNDVVQMVKNGVTSFHFSVEHWKYPMAVTRSNYEDLRIGWDIIIDIDSKLGIEDGKITAIMICDFLEKYNIKNYGIKFSGSRGFHISLPWIMFPNEIDYRPLAKRYPEVSRIIANFIRKNIKDTLMKTLVKRKGAKELFSLLETKPSELDPFYFVDVENNWGARHLFRAPFSLNEKKWLSSVPLNREKLEKFEIKDAHPLHVLKNIDKNIPDFIKGEENEATSLLTDALDWQATMKTYEKPKEKKPISIDKQIPEKLFPPCIKNILNGLGDGRKRSLFTLLHFLRLMNWPQKEIQEKVIEWNEKNTPPLPNNLIIGQLRWAAQNHLNPNNCSADVYYRGTINVCAPDPTCKSGSDRIKIRNPLAYPFKKMRAAQREKPKKKIFIKQYQCGICDKGFKNKKSLKIHKSRTHKIYD
ncbi:DNA primase small subunit domain-containing protein [Candidatus Aenigmatarchaeota archaeon]